MAQSSARVWIPSQGSDSLFSAKDSALTGPEVRLSERMEDPTVELRRHRSKEINFQPRNRLELRRDFGEVWSHHEMAREFDVLLWVCPLVIVIRKRDGAKGSLLYQHRPRFYFRFFQDDTL